MAELKISNDLQNVIKNVVLDTYFPVGSIYLSVNSTNPGTLFGGGTWEQIKSRFLVGTGSNDGNTSDYWGSYPSGTCNFPVGEMGGEPWHTLTVAEMPTHNHTQDGHSHSGKIKPTDGHYSGNNNEARKYSDSSSGVYEDTITNWVQPYIHNNGGGNGHNNMPPYYAVYMWKRIA